jgi:hypothetical protein
MASQVRPLAREPEAEGRGQRPAVAGLHGGQVFYEPRAQLEPDALRRQQRLDPIAEAFPILAHRGNLPRQLALRFGLRRRDVHHTPDLAFPPPEPPQEQRQQLADIQAIGFGPARPPIDFDARGVHHHVLHALGDQPSVEPESIPARFVTTPHGRVERKSKPRLRQLDLSPRSTDPRR